MTGTRPSTLATIPSSTNPTIQMTEVATQVFEGEINGEE